MQVVRWFVASTVLVLGFGGSALAQINMPDPSMINGKALPAGDLQTGTITVRVVRESSGNNIVGQQVTMTVNGEQLQSDPIVVPASGGLRVILVAGIAQAAERKKQEEAQAAAAPPVKGA